MAELNKQEFSDKMDDIIKRVDPYTKNNNDPFGGFERAEQAGAITEEERIFITSGFIAFMINDIKANNIMKKPAIKVEKGDQ